MFHQRVLRACQRGLRAFCRGLMACFRGLRASQRDLRASQRGLRASQRGLGACHRGLRACQEAGGDGRTYGRTDLRMYGISPHSTGFCPLLGPLPKSMREICGKHSVSVQGHMYNQNDNCAKWI